MIDLTQGELAALLLGAFLCGVALGVIYSGIRMLKMFFFVSYEGGVPRTRLRRAVAFSVTFLTDLFFWIFGALLSVCLLYVFCGGVFRGMIYPAMAAGFLAYDLTLGKLVLLVSRKLTRAVKRTILWILHLLLIPIGAIRRGIISLYHLTIGKFLGTIKRKINLARERRDALRAALAENSDRENGEMCGKEEKQAYVYVEGQTGYPKDGRIRFGGS